MLNAKLIFSAHEDAMHGGKEQGEEDEIRITHIRRTQGRANRFCCCCLLLQFEWQYVHIFQLTKDISSGGGSGHLKELGHMWLRPPPNVVWQDRFPVRSQSCPLVTRSQKTHIVTKCVRGLRAALSLSYIKNSHQEKSSPLSVSLLLVSM